jgi:hypothetical protein
MNKIRESSIDGSCYIIDVFTEIYEKWYNANIMGKIMSERLIQRWRYIEGQMKNEREGKIVGFIPVNKTQMEQN